MPPELTEKLRPLAGLLVQAVLQEIQGTVHAYSRPLEGRFGDTFRSAIETAIHQCLDAVHRPELDGGDWRTVFERAGRAEFLDGRTTEPLQAALRIGARVAWRHISANARTLGIPADTLLTMADAIFAWVDDLSAAAIAGHHEAQARVQAGNGPLDPREASRQLARALLTGEPADREWVHALAHAARWPLPDKLVVIAVERLDERDGLGDIGAYPGAIIDADGDSPCVLLPASGRLRQVVPGLLGRRRAAVGPAVAPAEAGRSLALARRLLGLAQAGGEPDPRISWCQDHLATLMLLADPFLTERLREYTDAVFAGLTAKQRDRMATTLLVWLQNRGTHNEIAARLDVHPQTLRYRIHQLQDLLGDRLSDPDARLTMELALRARMLPGRPGPARPDPLTA